MQQGNASFGSRREAVQDFERKYASQYRSSFPSEPSRRPDYIPGNTVYGGSSYPVIFDAGHGGYGSWVGSTWMAYSVVRDAAMLSALMNNHGYAYAGGPGYAAPYGAAYPYGYGHRSSGSSGLWVGLFCLALLLLAVWVVRKLLRAARQHFSTANPAGAPGAEKRLSSALGLDKTAAAESAGASSPHSMDKNNPADWQRVKPGSVMTLSDAQGIEDSMKRGQGVRGVDYTVERVARIEQLDGLATYLFFTLSDPEQTIYLLVKIVDQELDLYTYFTLPDLEPGSRQDLLDRGAQWLFQEPRNPQSFRPSELRYTTSLRQTLPDANGRQMEVLYGLKGQGEIQGRYAEQPARSGVKQLLATVVEYRAEQPVQNPELLVLEVGQERSEQTEVQFYLGCLTKLSEVDVLPV